MHRDISIAACFIPVSFVPVSFIPVSFVPVSFVPITPDSRCKSITRAASSALLLRIFSLLCAAGQIKLTHDRRYARRLQASGSAACNVS
ncbi:MAG: hypothetical protein J0G37_01300 [Afipia sp.]|nr:hypothetical protein [Afipia sp.]